MDDWGFNPNIFAAISTMVGALGTLTAIVGLGLAHRYNKFAQL